MEVVDSVAFRIRRMYEWIERQLATVNETPIFALGNQKTGTTAIAVLLAERARLSVEWVLTAGDSTLVVDLCRGAVPLDTLVEKNQLEFSRDVMKAPNLMFLHGPLRKKFAEAQFVMVMRDPRDNIRSILDRLELPGDSETLDSQRYDGMSKGWRLVVDGSWMGIEGENYVDQLAARWNRAARIYLKHQDDIKLIRYEDFMEGKVEAINDLVSSLGEQAKDGIKEKIDRQFQPRGHRRDVDWVSFFGGPNLMRIERRCAEAMNALGYEDYRTLKNQRASSQ
jgi:hypothetical protein